MTYATIQEAWGGMSGSHMLNTPLKQQQQQQQRRQPSSSQLNHHQQQQHQRQRQRQNHHYSEQIDDPNITYHGRPYSCMYDDTHSCNDVIQENHRFNQEKKRIATGMQHPPIPGGYTYLPQYPWYPNARANYLQYPAYISSQFYNHPYQYYPHIAQQIHEAQVMNDYYKVPMNSPPYLSNQFLPTNTQFIPPLPLPYRRHNKQQKEHFTTSSSRETLTNTQIIFIFFMVFLSALAIILCLSLIALHQQHKK